MKADGTKTLQREKIGTLPHCVVFTAKNGNFILSETVLWNVPSSTLNSLSRFCTQTDVSRHKMKAAYLSRCHICFLLREYLLSLKQIPMFLVLFLDFDQNSFCEFYSWEPDLKRQTSNTNMRDLSGATGSAKERRAECDVQRPFYSPFNAAGCSSGTSRCL